MHKKPLSILSALALLVACGEPNPYTPEGAHTLLVKAFGEKDYENMYAMLTRETKDAFRDYLKNTREVAALIRTKYPESLRIKAVEDLAIPFKDARFTYDEIEHGKSDSVIFASLCGKMFAGGNAAPSLMQSVGTKIKSVEMKNPGTAVVTTLAGEKLTYIREPDDRWRTAEIFGENFRLLVTVSRQNLEITKTNAELFSK